MEYSFPRYLLAKQPVDDRALNRHVLQTLRSSLPARPLRVIEVGAGMGNMLARLLDWNVLACAEYIHVDSLAENIAFARGWLPRWAESAGMCAEQAPDGRLRLYDADREVTVT